MCDMVDDHSDTPSSSADNPECFICTSNEGDVWPSDCKCKDRFMHPECQLRLLKNRTDMTCPVCLEKYNNVTFKQVRRLQWYRCNVGTCCVVLAFGLIAVFGCTMNTFFALAMKIQNGQLSMALLVSACSLGCIFTTLTGCLIRFVILLGGVRAIISSCSEHGREEMTITKPKIKMTTDIEMGDCNYCDL